MNKWMKGLATFATAVVLGIGGVTTANAATNDEIATYLSDAVAVQLGITSDATLRQLIVDAMANSLIDPAVTDAANAAVDGTSTMTPEELSLLLNTNLTQQLDAIEQQLVDLGVYTDPNTPVDPPVDPPVEPPVVVDDDDDAYEDDDDAYEDDDLYEDDDDSDDDESDDEDDDSDDDFDDDEDDADDEDDED